MFYFPKSRYITKYTNGGEFSLSNSEYIGPYYTTYKGEFITGENPLSPNQQKLNKILNDQDNSKPYNNIIFKSINPNINIDELIDPPIYIPIPNEEDYKKGKIIRYFAKQRKPRVFNIIEINKESHSDISERRGTYNYSKWDITSLLWQISGPLNNELKEGNIVRVGIIDTNKRIIESKNKNFIGLKEYLTDLSKFSKK